jgi:tetratricopeptide (TPR) repeat protein
MKSCFLVVLAALTSVQLAAQEENAASATQCFSASSPVQCEMDAGIESYKNARFQQAIAHFQRAVSLDPKLTKAHLYLGTAFANQFIPGADTPENTLYGEQAIAEFSVVADQGGAAKSDQLNAQRGIASLYFQMKKFAEARDAYRKVIDFDVDDPEAYYGIGVIDWTVTYTARMDAYAKLGIKAEQQHLDPCTCPQLAADHRQEVDEGIEMLVKAIQLRPDYDDAMAYMNLMLRERADLRCDDAKARAADLAEADKWVDATLATKKAKIDVQQKMTDHQR